MTLQMLLSCDQEKGSSSRCARRLVLALPMTYAAQLATEAGWIVGPPTLCPQHARQASSPSSAPTPIPLREKLARLDPPPLGARVTQLRPRGDSATPH